MVKKWGFLLIAFLFFQMQIVAAAEIVWISFYPETKINGPDILLGEIADIKSNDQSRVNQLRTLKLGNAAAPGGKIVFSERVLRLRLAGASGDYDNIVWNVPENVIIETRANTVLGNDLIEKTKKFLEEQLKANSEQREYTMDSLNIPNDLLIPEGNVTYEFKIPYGIKYGFPTNVNVFVYADGQLYKKTMVRIKIHVYEPVVVASHGLDSKQVITDKDVHLEKMDITNIGHSYFTSPTKVVGMVLKRVVNAGVPINSLMIDKPIMMNRNSMIHIVSNNGGIRVETDGQALQDGREGDLIRVKNMRSNKILSGKVIDSVTVDVSAH